MKKKTPIKKRRFSRAVAIRDKARKRAEQEFERTRWTPEKAKQRFPSQVDIMFGRIESNFARIYREPENLKAAERWRANYIKGIDNGILLATANDMEPDVIDALDSMRWVVATIPVHTFLKVIAEHESEVSINNFYVRQDFVAAADRALMLWERAATA